MGSRTDGTASWQGRPHDQLYVPISPSVATTRGLSNQRPPRAGYPWATQ
jgi:hypothetical protein